MPTQELINRSARIVEKLLIEIPAGDAFPIAPKADNLVIILKQLSASAAFMKNEPLIRQG
jgi:hypothetical protein